MVLDSSFPDLVIPAIPAGQYIVSGLEHHGEAVAITEVHSGRELTYKEIHKETFRYVKLLRKAGLKKGDVVGLVLPFDMQYSPLFLAIIYCNAVLFGTKLSFKSSIRSQLLAVKPTLVVTTSERLNELSKYLKSGVPTMRACVSFDQLQNIKPGSLGSIEKDLLSAEEINVYEDPAVIFQSSGTTGVPKCIVINHYRIIADIGPTTFEPEISPKTNIVFFMSSKIFHGFSTAMLFKCLAQGIKLVYASEVTGRQLFEVISKFQVNYLVCSKASLLAELIEHKQGHSEYAWPYLKYIGIGGEQFPRELVNKARDAFGIAVCQEYGLTEAGLVSRGLSNETPPESSGKLVSSVQLKIVDPSNEKELQSGQKGEICIRSPKLLMKYLVKDGAIDPTKDGWFHTGDLGYYDGKGFLYVFGRMTDVIKTQSGDAKVMAADLDQVLLRHNKISDAAVAGVPHSDYGEVPKAFVVKKDDSLKKEDVIAFFQSEVENMRLDGGVEFIKAIPRTELGKPLRRKLKELSMQNQI